MYHQKRNPYPTPREWWCERIGGLPRNAWALIVISAALALGFWAQDWDWVFGLR